MLNPFTLINLNKSYRRKIAHKIIFLHVSKKDMSSDLRVPPLNFIAFWLKIYTVYYILKKKTDEFSSFCIISYNNVNRSGK